MSKKTATTVYITAEQQRLLKELNHRSKVPIAEFVRQGIDMVLEKYGEWIPEQTPLPPGQPKGQDGSEAHP